jgi:hypothetical protein
MAGRAQVGVVVVGEKLMKVGTVLALAAGTASSGSLAIAIGSAGAVLRFLDHVVLVDAFLGQASAGLQEVAVGAGLAIFLGGATASEATLVAVQTLAVELVVPVLDVTEVNAFVAFLDLPVSAINAAGVGDARAGLAALVAVVALAVDPDLPVDLAVGRHNDAGAAGEDRGVEAGGAAGRGDVVAGLAGLVAGDAVLVDPDEALVELAVLGRGDAGSGLENQRGLARGTVLVGDAIAGEAGLVAGQADSVDEHEPGAGVAGGNAFAVEVDEREVASDTIGGGLAVAGLAGAVAGVAHSVDHDVAVFDVARDLAFAGVLVHFEPVSADDAIILGAGLAGLAAGVAGAAFIIAVTELPVVGVARGRRFHALAIDENERILAFGAFVVGDARAFEAGFVARDAFVTDLNFSF